MQIIIQAYVSDDFQKCTNCHWKGSMYDEPLNNCPLCFHRLSTEVGTGHTYFYSTGDDVIAKAYDYFSLNSKRKDDNNE